MYCKNCGKEIPEATKFCPECGTNQESIKVENVEVQKVVNKNASPKSRTIVAVLAFFFGWLGVHRFYVGKIGTGILTILLTCCFGIGCIWALIDLIIILCGNFKDSDGKLITDWDPKY